MKIFKISSACLFLIAVTFAGGVDLTGNWEGSTEVDGNPLELNMTLIKEGDTYTGKITAANFAENEPIKDVEFKDNKLSFTFTVFNGDEYLDVKIELSVTEDRLTGGWKSEDGNYGDIVMEKVST